jgi:hypothetical protein
LADLIERYGAAVQLARPSAGLWLALAHGQHIVDVVRQKKAAESVLHWEADHPEAEEMIERLEERYPLTPALSQREREPDGEQSRLEELSDG